MKRRSGPKLLAAIVTIAVVLTIIGAILLLDAPDVQRQRRLDARRVSDLININCSIDSYFERKNSLPSDLGALEREPGLRNTPKDPLTGAAYSYEITASDAYRLCATFARDSSDEAQAGGLSRKWSHGAGRQCFSLRTPAKANKDNGE